MCNKCKETPAIPTTEVKTPATTTVNAEPAKTKLGVKSFLPVVLYFDNDQPDARTKATRTAKTYEQAYNAYYPLRTDFGAKGDGAATVNFFDTKVKKGMDDLQKLASALVEITKSGEKVNLTVKGFASPLAPSPYNQALTGRRVSSIENYLSAYSGGVLAKYIKDGSIKLSLTTQGEETAKGGISDSAKDKKGSVYSVDASSERRVEITGIE
jgi:outer membrane protein OmpA-like peptidoglycan-associated protein